MLTEARASTFAEPVIVIEPHPGWRFINAGELWRARELMLFLAWRDIKVRYKQTVLGAAWAVLQPLAAMLVFSVFLRRVAAQPNAAVPYPLFVYSGMLPWMFFANSLTTASLSLVGDQNLVTKIYFPRLLIPMSTIAAALVDLSIGLGLLAIMMVFFRIAPGWQLLALPPLLALLITAAIGVGNLLSALTVSYRDFRHALPFLTQLWMFSTPSIYIQAAGALGPRGRVVMLLNPLYGLVANFRAAILGMEFDVPALMTSAIISLALFLVGSLYFRRMERSFADII